MIEIRGEKKVLVTPISASDLEDINIGDIIYLDGSMTTCRDVAHRRVVSKNMEIPVDIYENAIFHAGPIVRIYEDGEPCEGEENCGLCSETSKAREERFEMVSIGPTTSMRMEKYEYEFVKKTGVRVIIGKGGMKGNTERACREFGAIHCVFPAGSAVVAASKVEQIKGAEWRELGMPETLWECRVKEFGPLIVSIDAKGNNLFENNKISFNINKEKAICEISEKVGFIK